LISIKFSLKVVCGFHWVGQKKIPTVGVFPTVSVFSYGQINPTVKMPWLRCTHFVVPPIETITTTPTITTAIIFKIFFFCNTLSLIQ
jgi:hypothetical protein